MSPPQWVYAPVSSRPSALLRDHQMTWAVQTLQLAPASMPRNGDAPAPATAAVNPPWTPGLDRLAAQTLARSAAAAAGDVYSPRHRVAFLSANVTVRLAATAAPSSTMTIPPAAFKREVAGALSLLTGGFSKRHIVITDSTRGKLRASPFSRRRLQQQLEAPQELTATFEEVPPSNATALVGLLMRQCVQGSCNTGALAPAPGSNVTLALQAPPYTTLSLGVGLAVNGTTEQRAAVASALAAWTTSADVLTLLHSLDMVMISSQSSVVKPEQMGLLGALPYNDPNMLLPRNPAEGLLYTSTVQDGSSAQQNGTNQPQGNVSAAAATPDAGTNVVVLSSSLLTGVVVACVVPVVALAGFALLVRHQHLQRAASGKGVTSDGKGGAGAAVAVLHIAHTVSTDDDAKNKDKVPGFFGWWGGSGGIF